MKSYPLVRVPSQELSLWQSVVAEHVLKLEQATAKNQLIPLSISNVQKHHMIQATNVHVSTVFSKKNAAVNGLLKEPRKTASKKSTNAYLSSLCFSIGRAQIREDTILEKELKKTYRKYSDKDPGFLTCATTYAAYYAKYKGVLKYNSWKDHGGMQYGVISYKIPDDAKVAIIGDWGTGMSDAINLLSVLLHSHQPDVIIHLGDIYYSGTPDECASNFSKIFDVAFHDYGKRVPVFTIPGNHDYYAFGYGYYKMVKSLNSFLPAAVQDSSYFCLRTEDNGWQFLGMDTGYDDSNPANQVDTFYAGPQLQSSEIAWHKDKLDNFSGATVLLSHHQLCSGNAKINGALSVYGSYPYLNKYLLDVFRPYLGSKVAAWVWGHEHNQVIFENDLFGIPKGRLTGASAFEELTEQDPYKLNYPSAPFNTKYKLGHENGYYNHSYAIIDFSKRTTPSGAILISYYEYPSWGVPAPKPIPKYSKLMLQESLTTMPVPKGRPLVYNKSLNINLEKGAAFVSTVEKGMQYYPTVKQKPVALKLLGGTKTVKDGDIVQIQSLESGIASYNILGAWKTPALYYYKPGYDQQNWYIKKVYPTGDNIIYEGDPVYFINKFYAGQYLCPLIQAKNPGATYLSSDAKVPAVWYLKMK